MTLLAFRTELSIYAFVGIIMLVGLVKKNGIMMVDFAIEAQRDREDAAQEAIHEACLVRFRPIMMTTMAALMGTLPIALGLRRGRRVAPAARPRGRRRPGLLAVPDALRDAGLLRLVRAAARSRRARRAGPAGGVPEPDRSAAAPHGER